MKGSKALKALEDGHILVSEFAGGHKIRWCARRCRVEVLNQGFLLMPIYEDTWTAVALDIASLYKYEWEIVEDEDEEGAE